MKKLLFFVIILFAFNSKAQLKKDGTPDMRYKANKEMYGSSSPSYSEPSSYSTATYSSPSYSTPKIERNYDNGGQLKLQEGYIKSNGTYVAPHLKTTPDNITYNNYSR